MKKIVNDPLLAVARIGTYVVQVGLVIGMIALGIGLAVCIVLALGYVPEGMTVTGIEGMATSAWWIGALAIALMLGSLGLLNDFTVRLRQIIDTVGLGDPFVLDNAERLTRMAWTAVAVQVIMLAAGFLAIWVETRLDEDMFELNVDLSPAGIAMAVILFILARVFRKGAEMRAELEGTV